MYFYRVAFNDPTNKPVVSRIMKEARALNPSFLTAHIRGMQMDPKGWKHALFIPLHFIIKYLPDVIYTYYRTLCQESS